MEMIDYDFSAIVKNMNELSRLAWIVRSMLVDAMVKGFLAKHPAGTVVNLGCGMDTTFDRVDNGTCTWYDLDMPDVMELRKKFIAPSERKVFLSQSLLDMSWMNKIGTDDGVLLVASGVLYYLKEDEVRKLFLTIADQFPGCELVADLASPFGVRIANKLVIRAGGLGEQSFLTWGVKNVRDITAWDERIRVTTVMKYFKGRKRHLAPKYWFAAMISDALKIQYMVHICWK